jgi:hypothetical protein
MCDACAAGSPALHDARIARHAGSSGSPSRLLGNITSHPGVGLLFFVPGFEDALRVNGLARVTQIRR